jgi:hypothetical protein
MATVIGNRKVRTAQEIRNNQSLKFDIEIRDIMGNVTLIRPKRMNLPTAWDDKPRCEKRSCIHSLAL